MGPFLALAAFFLSITVIPLAVFGLSLLSKKLERLQLEKEVGGKKDSYGTLYKDSPFDLGLLEKAITLFITKYDAAFPFDQNPLHTVLGTKSLTTARKELIVEWVNGSPWFWSRDWATGKEYPEGHQYRQKNSGQLVGRNLLVVAAGSTELHRTAFIHELGHWALGIMTGEQDADHADGVAYGATWTDEIDELIREVNEELAEQSV